MLLQETLAQQRVLLERYSATETREVDLVRKGRIEGLRFVEDTFFVLGEENKEESE